MFATYRQRKPGSATQAAGCGSIDCVDLAVRAAVQPAGSATTATAAPGRPSARPSARRLGLLYQHVIRANGRPCSARSSASGPRITWACASRACSVTYDVPSAQPRGRRVGRRRAGLSWPQVTRLPDWPGERPGEPSDLLGQGVPGRRDLGGCMEQPQAAHSRPRESLGCLR
jgi:hypothetical protein